MRRRTVDEVCDRWAFSWKRTELCQSLGVVSQQSASFALTWLREMPDSFLVLALQLQLLTARTTGQRSFLCFVHQCSTSKHSRGEFWRTQQVYRRPESTYTNASRNYTYTYTLIGQAVWRYQVSWCGARTRLDRDAAGRPVRILTSHHDELGGLPCGPYVALSDTNAQCSSSLEDPTAGPCSSNTESLTSQTRK